MNSAMKDVQCIECGRRYDRPANVPRASLCPACRLAYDQAEGQWEYWQRYEE